jgi:hypothetical protein
MLTNSGTLTPGNSPGQLTVNNSVVLTSTSNFVVELGGATPGSGYDQLLVMGGSSSVTIDGTLSLVLLQGFNAPIGTQLWIIDNQGGGSLSGAFSGLANNAPVSASFGPKTLNMQINYVGNDVLLTTLNSVPEPGVAAVLSALGMMLHTRRRR